MRRALVDGFQNPQQAGGEGIPGCWSAPLRACRSSTSIRPASARNASWRACCAWRPPNEVSFFKHHREVEHQDGHATRELAPRRSACAPGSLASGDVAPDQAPARARSDQESLAYLPLLPHLPGARSYCCSLFTHTIQHCSCHGINAMKSSHVLSRPYWLEPSRLPVHNCPSPVRDAGRGNADVMPRAKTNRARPV